jgi:hypothetical protein
VEEGQVTTMFEKNRKIFYWKQIKKNENFIIKNIFYYP